VTELRRLTANPFRCGQRSATYVIFGLARPTHQASANPPRLCRDPGLGALGKSAKVVDNGYGGLTKAAEYGVKTYKELRKDLKGTNLQAHHLYEKRFSRQMGQKPRDMLAVAVTKDEHQTLFINPWRKEIPYGTTARAAVPEIEAAARKIYSAYPAITKSLGL
jgi:hypothetical protein